MKFAHSVWSLDYKSNGSGRIVTLKCESRAEQKLIYRSKTPLHYVPMPEANPFSLSAEILTLLKQYAPLSSRRLAAMAEVTPGAVRNAVADLRRRGAVRISTKSSRTTFYILGDRHAH